MARIRTIPESDPEPKEEAEVEEVEGEVVDEQKRTDAWQKAFDYAMEKGNTEKSASQYADSWQQDFEDK